MNNPNLDNMPADLLMKTVSLLPAKDALYLSGTSKKLKRDVGFSVIDSGLRLFGQNKWVGDYATGDIPRRGPEIPNLFETQTLSIDLQFDFVDQGWGNLKGQIFVVADRGEPYKPLEGFQTRRVVARSPGAQHRSTHIKLSFEPKMDEKCHLWYKVGGGGGHSLEVSNANVSYAIQGDNNQYFKCATSFLNSTGIWGISSEHAASHVFCRLILSAVTESLANVISCGREPDPNLAALFRAHGFGTINEMSLKALQLLLAKVTKLQEQLNPGLDGLGHDSEGLGSSSDSEAESGDPFLDDVDFDQAGNY